MMDTALRRHVSARGRQRHGQPPFTTQARLFAGVVASVVCLLFLFVGILAPLIVLHNMDAAYESHMRDHEYKLATAAVAPFRQVMVQALGISQALEGYLASRSKLLPNTSATWRHRAAAHAFDDFDDVGRTLRRDTSVVVMTALQPDGVYKYMSPANAAAYGRDTLDPNDNAQNYEPTPQQTIAARRAVFVGPFPSTSNVLRGQWGLAVRRPIFYSTHCLVANQCPFWGFAFTLVNISAVLHAHPIATHFANGNPRDTVDYLLSAQDARTGDISALATSLPQPTPEALSDFLQLGTTVDITPNHLFTVTIRGTRYGKYMSPMNITIVVACVLFGLLTLLGAFIAAVLWCVQGYDAAYHAPKLAPFAMLTIGPCRGEELWDRAPDQMAEVTEQLGQVLARQMVKHHAYQIQQVHPLTTSYVTRGVAAAVQMAHGAIEELQRRPVDDPLRRLLGDDGRLLLTCAVHWCTDAAVRVESLEGSYRYEGPDVVFGGRMWAFAAPGVVTASSAVARELPRFGLRSIDARPHRVVNVLRSRTLSGTTIGDGLSGSGSGSGSGDATIYVPYPVPTTVQATAGICCRGSIASPLRVGGGGDAEDDIDGDAEPLPQQQLFTLLDVRRPALVAAAEAAAAYLADKRCSASASLDHPNSGNVDESEELYGQTLSRDDGPQTRERVTDAAAPTHAIASAMNSSCNTPLLQEGARSLSREPPPHVSSSGVVGVSSDSRLTQQVSSVAFQGDAVTRALLRPFIPRAVDVALHAAFDYQAITLNMRYDAARVLVYYFHFSYKTLFRPLAAPERHNIFRRLVTAFGVPQQGILEHLAARCVIRAVQQNRKAHGAALQRHRARATTNDAPLPLEVFTAGAKSSASLSAAR